MEKFSNQPELRGEGSSDPIPPPPPPRHATGFIGTDSQNTFLGNKRPLSTPGNGQDGSVRKKTRRLSPTNNIEEQLKPTSLTPEESSVVKTSAEAGDNSNSWADVGQFYIGTYSLEPLTITMKQRILLQFLTPLAEYQEVRLRCFSLTASWVQIYILKEFSGTFLVLNSKSNIHGSYNCSSK